MKIHDLYGDCLNFYSDCDTEFNSEKLSKEESERITDATYAEKQAEEVAAKASSQGRVSILIPNAYELVDKSEVRSRN